MRGHWEVEALAGLAAKSVVSSAAVLRRNPCPNCLRPVLAVVRFFGTDLWMYVRSTCFVLLRLVGVSARLRLWASFSAIPCYLDENA